MENKRLDQYLARKLPQYSRAFLKSQIKLGNVLVNGAIKKPSYILKENDDVKINIMKQEKASLQPNPEIKLKIIYEDKNIIAIDKPAGISVHPKMPDETNTIANALLSYYPKIAIVGDEPNLRPGIVHRLDKDTSGAMVIAKNQKTFEWLKKQFTERKVEKKYTTLVCGKMKNEQGIISKPIGKTKDFRKRTTAPIKEQKEAVTYYKILEIFHSKPIIPAPSSVIPAPSSVIPAKAGIHAVNSCLHGNDELNYTLLEAQPKTGRTHQIRVHLASIGHPVAGDKLYSFKKQIPPAGLKRQFLHASYLKFSLPDGSMIEFHSELPKDLQKTLLNLQS